MGIEHQCRWVRHRLPLLAGDDLGVEERRKVERHLIGCPGCRDRSHASADALSALRSLAEVPACPPDAPSVWPALARQIRQSRHAAPRPSWWEIPLPRPWAAFGLTLGLGLGTVLASAIAPPSAPDPVAQPSAVAVDDAPMAGPETLTNRPPTVLAEAPARPVGGGALPQDSPRTFEAPTALRFDYDLDHGTPMSPGNRDPQRAF